MEWSEGLNFLSQMAQMAQIKVPVSRPADRERQPPVKGGLVQKTLESKEMDRVSEFFLETQGSRDAVEL